MKWIRIVVLITIIAVGCGSFCLANSKHVGIVKSVSGDVVIVRNGQTFVAEVNTKIYNKDLLKTGSDGKIGLVFEDDTIISMGTRSQIVIEDFLFEPAEKRMSFVARIIQGTASFLSGQMEKLIPEGVRLETPDAVIGFRGTRVLVRVE